MLQQLLLPNEELGGGYSGFKGGFQSQQYI